MFRGFCSDRGFLRAILGFRGMTRYELVLQIVATTPIGNHFFTQRNNFTFESGLENIHRV